MDTYRGDFVDRIDSGGDWPEVDSQDEDSAVEAPPSPVGQDERRMQVRAYNHWASLLGDRSFPSIEDLEAENIPDFGPYSVLLDFTGGIENPAIQFLGDKLALECGTDGDIETLADVPSRSLLSRITDHYMQILANQAPIGFEAEFVNQREATIAYRGILLPFSSDDDTIDFIYGVINWKELADQHTTDELMLEIDQALELDREFEAPAPETRFDALTDWADAPAGFAVDDADEDVAFDEAAPVAAPEELTPGYTLDLADEDVLEEEDEGEETGDAIDGVLDLSGYSPEDYADADSDDMDEDDTAPRDDDEEDEDAPSSFGSLLSGKPKIKAKIELPLDVSDVPPIDYPAPEWADDDALEEAVAAPIPAEYVPPVTERLAFPVAAIDDEDEDEEPATARPLFAPKAHEPVLQPARPREIVLPEIAESDDMGLADWLASARELAEAARGSEDRTRNALYAAIGRAYDFSLATQDAPEEFSELVADSGLTVQDRAPMTPVVKLVFGAEYDKTRLTEYASALSHAHRLGLARGSLADYLGRAPGGLKGVVTEERRAKRAEAGGDEAQRDTPREALLKKLRAMEMHPLEAVPAEGAEFTLLVARRLPSGEVVLLGEVGDDVPLLERAARKLVG